MKYDLEHAAEITAFYKLLQSDVQVYEHVRRLLAAGDTIKKEGKKRDEAD